MALIDDYVARTEGTCGKEKDIIVIFKYDRKEDVIKKVLAKATLKKSIGGIIFELTYKGYSFRFYGSGKAIFRDLRDKAELNSILTELLMA